MKSLTSAGHCVFISIAKHMGASRDATTHLVGASRRNYRTSCRAIPTPLTLGHGGGFAGRGGFASGVFYTARYLRFLKVAIASRYRYPGDSMKRPRFSRMPFAGGVAAFAMIVLSGCAAGVDGSADWAPVARQTTGRYQRVCTLPPATTQPRAPTSTALAAAIAPNAPGFDLRSDDKTLSVSLARWASMTGVTMRWMTSLQVPVTADSHVAGDLAAAMKSILAAVSDAGYPLTILQVADGKTWIVTDANDLNGKPLFGAASTNLAQVPKGASDARAH